MILVRCYYRGPQPIPTSADYHEAGVPAPAGGDSMNDSDMAWLMAKLREMLDEYEQEPFRADWLQVHRRTYRRYDNDQGVTLVVGMEPAGSDDD